MRRPWMLALLVAATSCRDEPAVRAQWTVTLRTDAPVPLVADRLLVEITNGDGTVGSRLIDASNASAWPISFGIADSRSTLRVRARLYRARATGVDGRPDPATTLDVVMTLPAEAGPVVVPLHMACFGQEATADESCDPDSGALAPIASAAPGVGDPMVIPGSWSESRSAPCASPAPKGMVCVPGGLFFFGDSDPGVVREQLVRLSSFFVDQDEFSVGRARALLRTAAKALIIPPRHHTVDRTEQSVCKYINAEDPTNDDQPVNCVVPASADSADSADSFCIEEGKRLITEAEFAYVAGNGSRGTRYPWGDDEDICAHAVVARDALPPFPGFAGELDTVTTLSTECRVREGKPTLDFGPVALNVPSRDETIDPPGVRNLSGNLSEWVHGKYASLSEPCWTGRPLLVDPVCTRGADYAVRGGAWSFPSWTAPARYRSVVYPSAKGDDPATNFVGFRCAKDAAPR
jgi:formylglycine-generating enzyme